MIEIGIDPVLWRAGSLAITWHGLFSAFGIIVGVAVAAHMARKAGLKTDSVYSAALWAIPIGLIGARLFHVVINANYYSNRPDRIFALQEGGLSIMGGLFGGMLAAGLYAKLSNVPTGKLADAAAPGLLLGQAVGRVGDALNGEVAGTATSVPWAVIYTHPHSLGRLPYATHPVAVYEILIDLLILVALLPLRGRLRPSGSLFLLYLSLFAAAHFALSFLRDNAPAVVGELTQEQIIALLFMIGGIGLWGITHLSSRQLPERPMRRFARRS